MGRKKENDFQAELIKEIYSEIPECTVLKNDSGYIQGFPDLTVLYRDKYAILECKRSEDEPYRPNQEYYLDKFAQYTFSTTVYPENKKEVMHELKRAFGV